MPTHSLTHLHIYCYAALLLLPGQFNETEIYLKIASLSYIGDPRMYVGGENPRKVFNLVLPKVTLYQQLYKNIFEKIAAAADIKLISGMKSLSFRKS